jgi:hypothetical protein
MRKPEATKQPLKTRGTFPVVADGRQRLVMGRRIGR